MEKVYQDDKVIIVVEIDDETNLPTYTALCLLSRVFMSQAIIENDKLHWIYDSLFEGDSIHDQIELSHIILEHYNTSKHESNQY